MANLLLARAVERQRDMGIRTALGARPARLMRLVVTEGFVIAGLSGVLALVLAWWTQSLVSTFAIPIDYVDALLSRVRALPGVTDVAVADRVPFFIGFERETAVWPDTGTCEAGACPKHATLAVGPGYFNTMGISLVAGREFESARAAAEVVINQSLARLLWPDDRGLGETLRIGDRGASVTVVGITARHKTRGSDRERPTLYVRLGREQFEGGLTVVARTANEPAPLVRSFVEAARAVDPKVAMVAVKTMDERMAVQLWPFRTMSWLFSIRGGLALILGTVGLASVVIHAVNSRRREFGVRVSVGATPRDLMADVLESAGTLLLPGLITGVILAGGAARLAQAVFIGVNVLNPLTYLAVALVQCAIVLIACLAPALGASRVDPLTALRAE